MSEEKIALSTDKEVPRIEADAMVNKLAYEIFDRFEADKVPPNLGQAALGHAWFMALLGMKVPPDYVENMVLRATALYREEFLRTSPAKEEFKSVE